MASQDNQAKESVSIPLEVAIMVRNVFLPLNPNKMRGAAPGVVDAAHAFKSAVLRAERQEGYWPAAIPRTAVLRRELEQLKAPEFDNQSARFDRIDKLIGRFAHE